MWNTSGFQFKVINFKRITSERPKRNQINLLEIMVIIQSVKLKCTNYLAVKII